MLQVKKNTFQVQYIDMNFRQRVYENESIISIMMDISFYPRELDGEIVSGTFSVLVDTNQIKTIKDLTIYNESADSGIITLNYNGVFAQDEASYLNSQGICVRSGEHCAKLLKDILKTPATVRVSFYFYNTKEEIDELYKALKNGGNFLDAYFN